MKRGEEQGRFILATSPAGIDSCDADGFARVASFASILAWLSAIWICWACTSLKSASSCFWSLAARGLGADRGGEKSERAEERQFFHRQGFARIAKQVTFLRPAGASRQALSGARGAKTACGKEAQLIPSAHGRPGNVSIAESFPAAGPCAAAPAESAHSPGASARAAQPRAAGNGDQPRARGVGRGDGGGAAGFRERTGGR